MKINPHIGHASQLSGVDEVRLIGGKGDGMRLFQVRTEGGISAYVSADRCADLVRLSYKGVNLGYFSPAGYVAPAYYDEPGLGFLKSFSCGFLTTCGLAATGSPVKDGDEELPLHGTIGNTPCERIWWDETDEEIIIRARINDGRIFGPKMVLDRTLTFSKKEGLMTISDTVENQSDKVSPLMVLYHMNMGYPLLSENSVLEIPSVKVVGRTAKAVKNIADWKKILPPTPEYEEECFYHYFEKEGLARLYSPDVNCGVEISFDATQLDHFIQWKMTGVRDYVMGLEPCNSTIDGRPGARENGTLKTLAPGESKTYVVKVRFFEK